MPQVKISDSSVLSLLTCKGYSSKFLTGTLRNRPIGARLRSEAWRSKSKPEYMFFSATPEVLPTTGLLKSVCHKAISPSVPYKVSLFCEKEAESTRMISKGKTFLTLEYGDVSFMCDVLG